MKILNYLLVSFSCCSGYLAPCIEIFEAASSISRTSFVASCDLVKKESGKTAQEYIHLKIIDVAKDKIFDTTKSISEVAYELGFKYPAHFTRMFKQHVGYAPNENRNLLN